MSFNSVGQYSASHKPYDHIGNIIPDVEHSEGARPSFEFQPAKWLPVQFYDKHYENWIVVMPGKAVGLDQDGFVMPAEYSAGIAASTTVTYTNDDVAVGTLDITTGVAVTTAKSVTLATIDGSSVHFMGRQGEAWDPAHFPIGVAPYAYLQHPGGDGFNPANFTHHNYNMQHQVAVLCDYVIKLPLVPGRTASETLNAAWIGSGMTFGTNDGWRNLTQIQATARYDASTGLYPCLSTYNVAAYPLDNITTAENTARTTWSSSDTTLLVNERSSMSALRADGDFWIDHDVGVLFVYSAGGSTMPTSGAVTLTYYHYAAVPSTISKFGCVLTAGELRPGDMVRPTTDSNWAKIANPTLAGATDNFGTAMGQVIAIYEEPRDYLDRVRTAYSSLNTDSSGSMANGSLGSSSVNVGQMDQMPGTATGGVSDLVHYAGAANLVVLVNLIGR